MAFHPASAPDREILFLGLPHSTEWQFQRSGQRLPNHHTTHTVHPADSAERYYAYGCPHRAAGLLQPDLDEKSGRAGVGFLEKSWRAHRLSLWRPGVQPLQRFSARRRRPFCRPGKNRAVRALGKAAPWLAIEFRPGAHELQQRVRPPVTTQGRALPLPDDLL